jgi:hypothetical protein
LGQIGRFRNDLVHLGIEPRSLSRSVKLITSKRFARSREAIRTHRVSADILNQLYTDLNLIGWILLPLANIRPTGRRKRGRKARSTDALKISITAPQLKNRGAGKPIAWLYKPH